MARHLCFPMILALGSTAWAVGIGSAQAQESPLRPQRLAQGETASVSAGLIASPGEKDGDSDTSTKGDGAEAKAGKGEDKDSSKAAEGEKAPEAAPVSEGEWAEAEGKTYHLVGARFRMTVIPQFMLGLFGADGGKTVWSPQVGPELAVRRNGFEYDVWLTYASYPMSNAPFKAGDDPDTAYEIIKSEIKTISVGSDFLWSAKLSPKFSFVYGGGAGIGVVFGNLYRTQSYPVNGVQGTPENYQACTSPGVPNASYCGTDNDHYPGYKEPSWISGGAKPVVFPWIAPLQIGARWRPAPKVVVRLDMGVAFPGPFFFGLAAQHGLF